MIVRVTAQVRESALYANTNQAKPCFVQTSFVSSVMWHPTQGWVSPVSRTHEFRVAWEGGWG